mmetsp:Transcript_34294/g.60025  ORF Transcript_34294/g.60025 Transcript_34294/m.60025 type:complete len:1030 (+) Transcript_34294:49-3138(+)
MKGFLLFFTLSVCCYAIKSYKIPSFGTPPVRRQQGKSCYDSMSDKVYTFGGLGESASYLKDLWVFDLKLKEWTELTSTSQRSPSPRRAHSCFIDEEDRLLYIFGGESNIGILNDMWAFSMDSATWEEVPQKGAVPPGITQFAYSSFTVHDKLLKFVICKGYGLSSVIHDIYIFDVESRTWNFYPSNGVKPKVDSDGAVVYYKETLLFFGGYKKEDNQNPSLADNGLYKYDFSVNQWSHVSIHNQIPNRNLFHMSIYKDYLYVFPGWSNEFSNQLSLYRINLAAPAWEWEAVAYTNSEYDSRLPHDSYGFDFKGSVAYFTLGWDRMSLKNDISRLDLSKVPLAFDFLTTSYVAPSARKNHQLIQMNTKLYIFGGEDSESKLGDLWSFNTETEMWQGEEIFGDSPTPRSGYSACTVGAAMFIYGGEGDLDLNQDFYSYDTILGFWTKYSDLKWPPARKHACIICDFPRFYIMGGITNNGYVSEIWMIDLQMQTVENISKESANGPNPFAYASCSSERSDEGLKLVLAFGESDGEYPMESMYMFNVETRAWITFSTIRNVSRAAAALVNGKVILAGGENWGLYGFDDVYAMDVMQNTTQILGKLPKVMYSAAYTYFKSSLYIHGGGDALGNKFRSTIPISDLVRVEMNEGCEVCGWLCSPGTFLYHGKCQACMPGTFSDSFGSVECAKCRKGTASRSYANTAERQCKPCDEGSFSDKEGSTLCMKCPQSNKCLVGSSSPFEEVYNPVSIKSNQPAIYEVDKAKLNSISYSVEAVVIGLAVSSIVIYICLEDNHKKYFVKLDMFRKAHNHFINEVMYIRVSPIGGLFSLLYILVAVFFVSVSLVTFSISNVEETKALVPLVTIEEKYSEIIGDFNLTSTFKYFKGVCGYEGVCSGFIKVEYENVFGKMSMSCVSSLDDCMVEITCEDCEVLTGAYVLISMLESRSYSTFISSNLTASSSIPDEYSSVEQSIKTSSNFLFSGAKPSKLYFDVTPSVPLKQIFQSDSPTWPDELTGYHIASTKAPVLGSQVSNSE